MEWKSLIASAIVVTAGVLLAQAVMSGLSYAKTKFSSLGADEEV